MNAPDTPELPADAAGARLAETPASVAPWRQRIRQLREASAARLARVRWLARLGVRLVLGFVVGSALLIGGLRWVDPPSSAFMVRHAIAGWWLGRTPPYYRHRWVDWERIPATMPLAVVAAEDQRFPLHHGFDPVEIRKALATWHSGGRLRGASTITQQTAKNLFLWTGRNWMRKGLEAWFAVLIELLWPKQRILEIYLNIVQFSPSTYGVGAAAERYFNHPAEDLTARESALLAAVLTAPSAYRLDRPSARLQRRASWILDQTQRLGGTRYLERM